MVEDKVESNDGREIEQGVNVAETSQLSGKKQGNKQGPSKEQVRNTQGNEQGTKQGKKQGDTTVESTYTCPICGEYSNSDFSSVNAHARGKHGKQLILDNNNNIVIASKNRGEKESSEQEKNKSIPYAEVEPADVFLRNFLSEFDFKEQFIDLLCRRVRRRNALPYPNDLAADIQDMPSGITNPKSANYIAEEYGYDFKEYEKRLKSTNKFRSSMGYDVGSPDNTGHDGSHYGISLDRYKGDNGPVREFRRDGEKEKEKPSVDPIKEVRKRYRARKAEYLEELMDVKEIADMERRLDGGEEKQDEEIKQLREENRRLREGDGHRNDPNSEMRERIVKLEDDIRQRDVDRMQRLDDELKAARNTPPPRQTPTGPSRDEVTQMVLQTIEAQTKKLTSDDVERIVQRAVGDFRSTTKDELVYNEARDKMHLEEKKLDESGKTRDVIGNAIRDGFGHAGRIISRMMTGEGETTGMPVEGYTDQAEKMMQMACPACNTVITAPIGSPKVVCPGCGKRWDVERVEQPSYEQAPKKAEEKKPPVEEFVSKEKKAIEKSVEDTKEGEIKPSETSESTSDAPKIISEPTTDAPKDISEPGTIDVPKDVRKIAENIAIGEATDYLEEELKKKKELSVEKKPWPTIDSDICPICNKKCKSKRGVGLHVTEVHPEYKK